MRQPDIEPLPFIEKFLKLDELLRGYSDTFVDTYHSVAKSVPGVETNAEKIINDKVHAAMKVHIDEISEQLLAVKSEGFPTQELLARAVLYVPEGVEVPQPGSKLKPAQSAYGVARELIYGLEFSFEELLNEYSLGFEKIASASALSSTDFDDIAEETSVFVVALGRRSAALPLLFDEKDIGLLESAQATAITIPDQFDQSVPLNKYPPVR